MATRNSSNEPTAASGKVLQGQGDGVASNFSSATYPSVAGTSGNLITSDGTNFVSTPLLTVTSTAVIADNAIVRGDGGARGVQTSVPTIDDTGNILVSASVSGASLSLSLSNTSNTASSSAFVETIVAGSSADDAYYKATVTGGQSWSWGVDNSDSDAFVISANATLGTSNIMRCLNSGEINYPLQPAFLASNSLASDVTGNNTTYTMIYDNEVYDQNNDYDGTSTFTSPVTGRYLLNASIVLGELGALFTACTMIIVTSNRSFTLNVSAGGIERDAANILKKTISCMCDMDAADTSTVTVNVSGSTKTIDTNADGYFSGYLMC